MQLLKTTYNQATQNCIIFIPMTICPIHITTSVIYRENKMGASTDF